MLITGKPDRKAWSVPVLRDGAEVVRLRADRSHAEWLTADVGSRGWAIRCTWDTGGSAFGVVTGRPLDDDGAPPMRGRYSGFRVREVELDGRPLQIEQKSALRGMHRYTDGGRFVAETGTRGALRVRTSVTADEAVPLEQQVFLICMDLYSCRRNTSAAQTLGFRAVPVPSFT